MSKNIYKEYKPAGGAGSFVKFEDGNTLRFRIVSDPVIFDSIYEGRASTKYAWLVFNTDDKEVQIMQLPKTGYRSLAAIGADDDYGDPAEGKYDIKVTRTGQRQQTKYNIIPVKAAYKLTKDDQEAIDEVDLIERLSASDSNQRVAWLRDEIDGKREKKKVEIEDVDDEPVNLDDLPL